MEATTTIRLRAVDLFDKWGFRDGDALDDVLFDNDIDPSVWTFDGVTGGGYDHRQTFDSCLLIAVVREFLVPAIPRPFGVHRSYSAHNPIRADMGETVDGLDDIYIDVSPADVLRIARDMIAKEAP
jgi:hypothetical protein